MPARKTKEQLAAELAELEASGNAPGAGEPDTYQRRALWCASLKPLGHGPQE